MSMNANATGVAGGTYPGTGTSSYNDSDVINSFVAAPSLQAAGSATWTDTVPTQPGGALYAQYHSDSSITANGTFGDSGMSMTWESQANSDVTMWYPGSPVGFARATLTADVPFHLASASDITSQFNWESMPSGGHTLSAAIQLPDGTPVINLLSGLVNTPKTTNLPAGDYKFAINSVLQTPIDPFGQSADDLLSVQLRAVPVAAPDAGSSAALFALGLATLLGLRRRHAA